MATLATLADGSVIDDTELYAKYTGSGRITVSLPEISAAGGSATDVAPESTHTVACEGAGTVIVLDFKGRRVGIVGPYSAMAFRSLDATEDTWVSESVPRLFQVTADNVLAAGAATPTLGTAAPIVAGAPTKFIKVIGEDGVPYVLLAWTAA